MNLAAKSTSSDVSARDKKMSTTSFGSSFAGGDYLATTLERLKNKPEAPGTCLKYITMKEFILYFFTLMCRRQCV